MNNNSRDYKLKELCIKLERLPANFRTDPGLNNTGNNKRRLRSETPSAPEDIPGSPEEKSFAKCKLCEKSFPHRQSLHRHMKLHQKTNTSTVLANSSPRKEFSKKCTSCQKMFRRQDSYQIHVKQCKEREKIKCGKCPLKFFQLWQLTRHQLQMHRETEWQCCWCSQFFVNKWNLRRHLMRHLRDTVGMESMDYQDFYRMQNCFVQLEPLPEKRKAKKSVRFNMKGAGRILLRKKNYECKFCGRGFWLKKNHWRHLEEHVAEEEARESVSEAATEEVEEFQKSDKCRCKKCDKEFDLEVSLLSHYMFAHAGRRPLKILN